MNRLIFFAILLSAFVATCSATFAQPVDRAEWVEKFSNLKKQVEASGKALKNNKDVIMKLDNGEARYTEMESTYISLVSYQNQVLDRQIQLIKKSQGLTGLAGSIKRTKVQLEIVEEMSSEFINDWGELASDIGKIEASASTSIINIFDVLLPWLREAIAAKGEENIATINRLKYKNFENL